MRGGHHLDLFEANIKPPVVFWGFLWTDFEVDQTSTQLVEDSSQLYISPLVGSGQVVGASHSPFTRTQDGCGLSPAVLTT